MSAELKKIMHHRLRSFLVCARSWSALALHCRALSLLVGFFSLLSLFTPPAQAGYYTPEILANGHSYSGDAPFSYEAPYALEFQTVLDNPTLYNWDPHSNTFECWSNNSADVHAFHAQGPITIRFSWQPTNGNPIADPPPTAVLVQESSEAWWWAPGNTGSCYDDIDDSVVYYQFPDDSWAAVADGTRYSIGDSSDGGQTFTVTCEPYADAGDPAGSAGADYFIALSPITVNLTGPAVDGDNHFILDADGRPQILTGQQISATLNINDGPGILDSASYDWSCSSSDAFKTYNETAASHQLILLSDDPSYTTGDTFSFYDKKAEDITVSCDATIIAPDDTELSVTAQSRPVAVLKPSATWDTKQGSLFSPGFVPSQSGIGALESWWPINITVPSPFSGGTGCLAQLITPTIRFTRYPLNGQPDFCYYKVPGTVNGVPTMVLPGQGLDTHFPYPTGDITLSSYPNGYQWDVSETGYSGDGPDIEFAATSAADNGGNDWHVAYATELFTTWLMYKPSSGGSGDPKWIPLKRVDWFWHGNVSKDSTSGQWADLNPNDPSTAMSTSASNTTDVPQWTTTLTVPDKLYP